MSVEGYNKAQRLIVAGSVAPSLRRAPDHVRNRKVAKVDPSGKVVGYTTLAEVQKALLFEREIELAVQDDVRPTSVICEWCGKTILVQAQGNAPRICRLVDGGCQRQKRCAGPGCKEKPRGASFSPFAVRSRKGQPWVCKRCSVLLRFLSDDESEAISKMAYVLRVSPRTARRWLEKMKQARADAITNA